MSAGKPTILAIDGVIRDVIEKANGGIFVSPGDDRALADAVLYLHENPSNAKVMGQSARAYVETYFDRRKQVQVFAALLEQVMSEG